MWRSAHSIVQSATFIRNRRVTAVAGVDPGTDGTDTRGGCRARRCRSAGGAASDVGGAVLVGGAEDHGGAGGDAADGADLLDQFFQRGGRGHPHLEDVVLVARDAGQASIAARCSSRCGTSSGAAASNGLMDTKAVSGRPTSSGSNTATYPLITPSCSSLRTRWWTADTERPACRASSVKLIRPLRVSSDTILRSISSTKSR